MERRYRPGYVQKAEVGAGIHGKIDGRMEAQDRARHATREKRFARRADLDDEFIEQTSVVALPREITASNDPGILAIGSRAHFGMNRAHIATDEPDIRTADRWELAA